MDGEHLTRLREIEENSLERNVTGGSRGRDTPYPPVEGVIE